LRYSAQLFICISAALKKSKYNPDKLWVFLFLKGRNAKKVYNAIVERAEVLLQDPNNIENKEAQGYIELNILSDLVADFEENYYPIKKTNTNRNDEIANA
jgi:hypothetical protein